MLLNSLFDIGRSRESQQLLLSVLPAIPLLGTVLICLLSPLLKKRKVWSGIIATAAAFLSFFLALLLFCGFAADREPAQIVLWSWFRVGLASASFGFYFDELAAVMSLIVTGVGSLIHLYAIGYMADDHSQPRFFAYLNLFLFAMLLLVLGSSLLVLFVGWEGVGLCSYLLIGFWFRDMKNAEAGQKAFVVNRIGDASFLLGIFFLYWVTGSFEIETIANSPHLTPYFREIAAVLLLVGALGKSAQFPLYVWLPDAMAGPTPVSALIHAATMVTAGVYMIARMHALYASAPITSLVITILGTLTAFLAATIATVQNDIKKVLAYSTISQLGYMFIAVGVTAYSYGIYHVVTHAFFKALLFLAAGSVIVGCHHQQDMRKLGGLWQSMAMTFMAYLVGVYAIVGLPPGSGYYSKDAILWALYSDAGLGHSVMIAPNFSLNQLLFGLALLTAFLTAFYMMRSLILTFLGDYRGTRQPEESGPTMLVPLAVLMVPSLLFGYLLGDDLTDFLQRWGRQDLPPFQNLSNSHDYHLVEIMTQAGVIGAVVLSIIVFLIAPAAADFAARRFSFVHNFLLRNWLIDDLYNRFLVPGISAFARFSFRVIDRDLVDGAVNGSAGFIAANGDALRRMHLGRVTSYAFIMFLFVILILTSQLVL